MTDDDKALDKIIRTSMPFDFERKETLSDDKALVERLDNFFLTDQTPFRCDAERAARLIEAQAAEIERLRELLAVAYIQLSGKDEHASDCATSNAPAMTPGRCDCD